MKRNETKLEKALAQAEHLKLHHEGESAAEAARADDIEAELKQLREDLVKANMALSHAEAGNQDIAADLKDAKANAATIEAEMVDIREQLSKAKDDLSAANVENSKKLEEMNNDLMKLATELAEVRHELGAKTEQLSHAKAEQDRLELLCVEHQRTIKRLELVCDSIFNKGEPPLSIVR